MSINPRAQHEFSLKRNKFNVGMFTYSLILATLHSMTLLTGFHSIIPTSLPDKNYDEVILAINNIPATYAPTRTHGHVLINNYI